MPVATRELKVVVLGTGGVGKSALSMQYVQSVFVERYDPTIEDSYRKVIEIPTEWVGGGSSNNNATTTATLNASATTSLVLEIMDTAGTEQFTAMRELYMRNGDAFLLVYAVDSTSSLSALGPIYEQLLRVRGVAPGTLPVLLVGNKCDLDTQRQVSRSQAQIITERWKLPPPVETSARQNLNVTETFMQLVQVSLTRTLSTTFNKEAATLNSRQQRNRSKNKCRLM